MLQDFDPAYDGFGSFSTGQANRQVTSCPLRSENDRRAALPRTDAMCQHRSSDPSTQGMYFGGQGQQYDTNDMRAEANPGAIHVS